jgi:hypothetical protein
VDVPISSGFSHSKPTKKSVISHGLFFGGGSARRSRRRSARRSAYRIIFNDVSLVDPQQSLQAKGIKDLAKVRISGDVLASLVLKG